MSSFFRQLVKTKKSYKLATKDKSICYSTFRDHLTKRQILVSIAPIHLDQGGASEATNSGVSDRIFQRHGCWKSVAAKDG